MFPQMVFFNYVLVLLFPAIVFITLIFFSAKNFLSFLGAVIAVGVFSIVLNQSNKLNEQYKSIADDVTKELEKRWKEYNNIKTKEGQLNSSASNTNESRKYKMPEKNSKQFNFQRFKAFNFGTKNDFWG